MRWHRPTSGFRSAGLDGPRACAARRSPCSPACRSRGTRGSSKVARSTPRSTCCPRWRGPCTSTTPNASTCWRLAARAPLEPIETVEHAPDALVRLITSMEPAPAYVLGPYWDFLAWNRPQSLLYPLIDRLADEERNLLWVVFAEPNARRLLTDWEDQARRIMAEFRSGTACGAQRSPLPRSDRPTDDRQPGVRRMVAAARRRPVPDPTAPLRPPARRQPGVRVPATDPQRMARPAGGVPAPSPRRRQRGTASSMAQYCVTPGETVRRSRAGSRATLRERERPAAHIPSRR